MILRIGCPAYLYPATDATSTAGTLVVGQHNRIFWLELYTWVESHQQAIGITRLGHPQDVQSLTKAFVRDLGVRRVDERAESP